MFRSLFGGKKKKVIRVVKVKENNIKDIVHGELQGYIKREDLQKYIDNIQNDKDKKRIWDGLSTRQKTKVLRRIAEKRGLTQNEKKYQI
jgi:DNA-binding phage protein